MGIYSDKPAKSFLSWYIFVRNINTINTNVKKLTPLH